MTLNESGLNDLPEEAGALWNAALGLARLQDGVSLPPLLVFTDPVRVPDPAKVAQRLPAGSGLVFRHFGVASAEKTAWQLREITARRGVTLMIGLDAELADRIGADGLHLPRRSASMAKRLRENHPLWLMTAAAHRQDPGVGAGPGFQPVEGLDALVLAPAFSTRSPSPARPALGPGQIADFVAASTLPVYALGGINLNNVSELSGTGICGIAGVDGFVSAFCS